MVFVRGRLALRNIAAAEDHPNPMPGQLAAGTRPVGTCPLT